MISVQASFRSSLQEASAIASTPQLQHSLAYLAARLVPACLGPLSIAVFIRMIGASEYGQFSLIYALVLIIDGFATQWLSQPVLRFQSGFRGAAANAFTLAVRRGTILSFVVGTGSLLLLAPWLVPSTSAILAAATLALIAQIEYGVMAARIQAALEVRRFVLAESARAAIAVATSAIAILTFPNHGSVSLLMGTAAGAAIGSLMLRPGRRRTHGRLPPIPQKDCAPVLFSYGWPMAIWAGLSVVLNLSDRYVIARFGGLTDVGTYSAVYDLIYKGVGLLLTPVVLATHPLVMAAWNDGENIRAARILRQGVRIQLVAGFLILGGCTLCARTLSQMILGTRGISAAGLVSPIAAGAVFWQFAMLAHKPIELAGMTLSMAAFGFCALVVNVGLNLWLIPLYGYSAAAYTTALTALTYLGLVLGWMQSAAGKPIAARLSSRGLRHPRAGGLPQL